MSARWGKGFGAAFSYQLVDGERWPGLWFAREPHIFEFDRRVRSALLRRDRRAARR